MCDGLEPSPLGKMTTEKSEDPEYLDGHVNFTCPINMETVNEETVQQYVCKPVPNSNIEGQPMGSEFKFRKKENDEFKDDPLAECSGL